MITRVKVLQVFNLDNDYRGDKLRLARMAKGLSCEELANKLDKTKQFVSKLEKGARPSEQLLEQISQVLGIQPSFLFSERKYPLESDLCHFRSKKSRTQTLTNSVLARAEMLNVIISVIEDEIELPDLNIPDISSYPLNSVTDIERIAEECRRQWGLGLGPISSMSKLAERLGVIVTQVTGVDDRVDAFTVHNKRPVIIRNDSKKSVCRFRSDIGHELGHLVMHDGILTGDHKTESQADQFSSALLVPRISFINEFPKIRGKQFDWNAMVEFKLRWKISLKMAIYRAASLGLLSQIQARTGYIHLNTKGYTRTEPGDERIPEEKPVLLEKAINLLDDNGWLNVLKKAGLSVELVRDLFGVHRPITDRASVFKMVVNN
ncbi:helix-turn-helix domain-containing protein [Limnobaculum xujianqingii]|uniref:helix-turn-helix domain-containing protein n=1 Tax=Limnobaculum xujianqingii TaxID=2738837 RepID=UPI00112A0C7B|nr:XRE family transcriptional regulator [Limnobaculum xujianqingii]